MSGAEVIEYLNAVATKPVDTGAYAQFYGLSMEVNNTYVSKVKINGKAIDLMHTYRFTIPSFNAAGGDGYPNITNHAGFVNTGFVDAEVLKDYLQSHTPLNVSDYDPAGEISYK